MKTTLDLVHDSAYAQKLIEAGRIIAGQNQNFEVHEAQTELAEKDQKEHEKSARYMQAELELKKKHQEAKACVEELKSSSISSTRSLTRTEEMLKDLLGLRHHGLDLDAIFSPADFLEIGKRVSESYSTLGSSAEFIRHLERFTPNCAVLSNCYEAYKNAFGEHITDSNARSAVSSGIIQNPADALGSMLNSIGTIQSLLPKQKADDGIKVD
jgi:hypothetical protein